MQKPASLAENMSRIEKYPHLVGGNIYLHEIEKFGTDIRSMNREAFDAIPEDALDAFYQVRHLVGFFEKFAVLAKNAKFMEIYFLHEDFFVDFYGDRFTFRMRNKS